MLLAVLFNTSICLNGIFDLSKAMACFAGLNLLYQSCVVMSCCIWPVAAITDLALRSSKSEYVTSTVISSFGKGITVLLVVLSTVGIIDSVALGSGVDSN